MNRKIIIALIIIVLIILAGIIVFSHNNVKLDTQINFISNNTLQNGDQVQFELKDAQGNALENQNITISFSGNGKTETYSVITDSQGSGALLLNEEPDGAYNITVTYDGDEKHNSCSASQTIKIGEVSENSASTSQSTTQSSESSSNLNYDSELNDYYDSNGKIVGGQNDGADYNYIKNNPQTVVNGSLE